MNNNYCSAYSYNDDHSNTYGFSGNNLNGIDPNLPGSTGTCRNPYSENPSSSYIKLIVYKVLDVLYIFLITENHLHLIISIFMKYGRHFYRKQLITITLSLSIGDMLLALFSLVVEIKLLLENIISCTLVMNARNYKYSILPFVHGIGLTTMAAEIAFRHRVVKKFKKWPVIPSVIYSLVPWVAGLAIALPVATIGRDTCIGAFTADRERAILMVCMIVPSLIAFIVGIITVKTKTKHFSEDNTEVEKSAQNTVTVFETPKSQQAMPRNQAVPELDYLLEYPQPHLGNPHAHPEYPQLLCYLSKNPSVSMPIQTSGSPNLAKQKMDNEKSCVVRAAQTLFILSLPYPLYELIVATNPNLCPLVTSIIDEILSSVAYWLFISRAVASAMIFQQKLM